MTPGGDSKSLMSDINVTPFVDVMLVLLIIFMVTAPMMIQGVDVTLPEADTGPLAAEEEKLVISIDRENRVYINDLQVTVDFLQEKLKKIMVNRVDREVLLRADKEIAYGLVVRVMSEIKGAGVEKLGMLTEPVNKARKK